MGGIAALVVAAGGTVLLTTMPLRQPPPYVASTPPPTSTTTIPAAGAPASTTTSSAPVQAGTTTSSAAAAPGMTTNPSTSESTTPSPSSTSPPTDAAGLPPTALVIGDGYTAPGQTPGAVDQSFVCQAVRAHGWGCINASSTGSGYLSEGTQGSFATQLTQAVTPSKVGLVVITGGVADRLASPAAAETAVRTTLATARSTYPNASLVVLRPFATLRNTTTLRAVALTLAEVAKGRQTTYVDTLGWFDAVSPATSPDGTTLSGPAVAVAASSLYSAIPDASAGG
ncbi:SGNH/GDSL hydrolase family protein [Lapillicoccus jejuensis]|uniref:SGNH/GDSL hydrolase family protein n=1 Tax=Lapillicoccus jejuensis TaxID=402171 RepID=UPI0011510962|nr:SGNH/GDSL hydrolase family protein [Lapillicoccus jejuensis]